MLQILGRPASINVRKVLWTCAELSLRHELTPWGQGDLALDAAEFRALNPNGLVCPPWSATTTRCRNGPDSGRMAAMACRE